MKLLTECYQADLPGVLSCYDRMIITGTLPGHLLRGWHDQFSEFPPHQDIRLRQVFADPLRERIRKGA